MHQSRKEQGIERSSRRLLSPDRREAIHLLAARGRYRSRLLNGLAAAIPQEALVPEVNEESKNIAQSERAAQAVRSLL